MSLINEALKKAQKQRQSEADAAAGKVPAPDPDPGSGGGKDPEIYVRSHRRKRGGNWGIKAGGVALVVLAVVLIFRPGSQETTADAGSIKPVASPAPTVEENTAAEPVAQRSATGDGETTSPTTASTPIETVPAPAAAEEPAEAAVAETPVSTPIEAAPPTENEPDPAVAARGPEASSPPVTTATEPSRPAVNRPAPTAAAPGSVRILSDRETETTARAAGAATSSREEPRPSDAVLNYLERSRVTGVRVSPTDPKVLMNDRVYRLNEIVDRDLRLRIIAIGARELKFEDPQGYVYTKTF